MSTNQFLKSLGASRSVDFKKNTLKNKDQNDNRYEVRGEKIEKESERERELDRKRVREKERDREEKYSKIRILYK